MDDSPRELLSDIIFVNDVYDSRKTGVSALTHSPSTYRLYISPEFLSFTCNQINTQQHRHFPIQLAFNFEKPFLLSIDGSKEFRLFFFIIPTDTPHKLISTEGKHLTILVDPLSLFGRKLRTRFEHQEPFVSFSESVIYSIYGYFDPGLFDFKTAQLLSTILASLNEMISELPECSMDNRIREAVTHCQAKGGRELCIADLAGRIFLSESRARHLFKAETGVTFKRYLKWLKTLEAIKYTCSPDINLTEAAHIAGFSDSAHLSRTFKEIFGLKPSSILQ
jgi:AraC-like DNA-binding protein